MNYAFYKRLPRKWLSQQMYRLARIRNRPVKNTIIWLYQKITNAKTDFAKEKNPYHYRDLNDFFTRELADGARPVDPSPDALISPVDGRCAICGRIEEGQLFQAKQQRYSLEALLNSAKYAQTLKDGSTVTLYLAPDDYHRIHMPCAGQLTAMSFCPGDKHSVALDLLEKIPNLFAGNERLVCHFETEFGRMAMVMVGAMNVSSIETVWHGELHTAENNHYTYDPALSFAKGEEIARFNLGSTVILCFEKDAIELDSALLESGEKIRMGERIGSAHRD